MHSVCQVYAIDANAYQVYPFFTGKRAKNLISMCLVQKKRLGFHIQTMQKLFQAIPFFPSIQTRKLQKCESYHEKP